MVENDLVSRLGKSKLFSHLPVDQIDTLLSQAGMSSCIAGTSIVSRGTISRDVLVLVSGRVEVKRARVHSGAQGGDHTLVIKGALKDGPLTLITSIPQKGTIRALDAAQYFWVDGDNLDELLGLTQIPTARGASAEGKRRLQVAKRVSAFRQMPLENVMLAFERMQCIDVKEGEQVVAQGEVGDHYYVIDEGEAEVWRKDPISNETECVAILGEGAGFGEEALVQNANRNASVKMISDGKLFRLSRDDFESLVRPNLVEEVAAENAKRALENGDCELLDCRFDIEFEDERIPGARLFPLHEIRERAHELDHQKEYLIYCRSGRRSQAAAFLLKERDFRAKSIVGGIVDWPFEVDESFFEVAT